ncbi:MAG: hypothetical protein JST70_01915 [Bacteroidetes bacterium]|nr:hypothetical protein [Bacteroidota bacterium]
MLTHIDGPTYRTFCDAFKQVFISKEFALGKSPYGRGDDSPDVWKHINPVTKKSKILEIIDFCLKDPTYFYRQYGLIKDEGKKLNSKAIGKALEYMEYTLPEDLKRSTDWHKKTTYLIAQFKANPNNYIYAMGNPSPLDGALLAAQKCVESFYKYLAMGNTKEAWNLLAPMFQNRDAWQGNYERFHEGYRNTVALKNICAFNGVQAVPGLIDCMVFYEDEVSTYPINRMQALTPMTIAELDDFSSTVKKIHADIEEKGGIGFDRIPIRKLFDTTGTEYIWYECFFKGNELNKHFAKPRKEVVLRLCHCHCILQDNRWLIKNISPAKIQSIH